MPAPIIIPANLLLLDLTAPTLLNLGYAPLTPGDDWELRFQVLSADGLTTQDLTNALILCTLQAGNIKVTRRSDTNILGSSPARKQIELDSQGTDNGPTGTTGRGWGVIRYGREASDTAALKAVVGVWPWDVRIKFGSASVSTYARANIQVVGPITDPVA